RRRERGPARARAARLGLAGGVVGARRPCQHEEEPWNRGKKLRRAHDGLLDQFAPPLDSPPPLESEPDSPVPLSSGSGGGPMREDVTHSCSRLSALPSSAAEAENSSAMAHTLVPA